MMRRVRKNHIGQTNHQKFQLNSTFVQRLRSRLHLKHNEQQELSNMLRREKTNQTQNNYDGCDHEVFKLRRNVQQYLRSLSLSRSPIIVQKAHSMRCFLSERSETPKYIYVCCEGLFFHYTVKVATRNELEQLAPNSSMFTTKYICSTCRKEWKANPNKLPTRALKNRLEFPVIPDCLKNLTSLEERFISPFVNFMQIRDLTPYA